VIALVLYAVMVLSGSAGLMGHAPVLGRLARAGWGRYRPHMPRQTLSVPVSRPHSPSCGSRATGEPSRRSSRHTAPLWAQPDEEAA
jgi:hypothetical protein